MPVWPGRLFGPQVAAGGEEATVEVVGRQLVVRRARAGDLVVPAGALRLRRVGVDERGLELSFRAGEVASPPRAAAADGAEAWIFAVHVLAPDAARAVLDALPAESAAEGRGLRRHDESRRLLRRAALAALALVLLLPLLLLALLVANFDALTGLVVERIPRNQEMALRERYVQAFEADPSMRRAGPRHDAVTAIAARLLAPGSDYDYVWFVADDASVNAFALPGGVVVVHDGLISATATAEELAGVLAHEIQHVELRHGLHAVVRQAGLAVAIALVTGDATGTLAGEIGRQLVGLKFSRDAEREADATGLRRLLAAGIDPQGMIRFFDTLGGGGAPVEFLSTHPGSEGRARALRGLVQAAGPAAPGGGAPLAARDARLADWPPPAAAPPS